MENLLTLPLHGPQIPKLRKSEVEADNNVKVDLVVG